MAADHMTLSSQEADLLRVQETFPINFASGDKKMPAPPVFFEKVGDARDRAFPAVIESQKKRKRRISCIREFLCGGGRGFAYPCDGRKMFFEFGATQFVLCRSGASEAARIPVESLNYIMIEQTDGSH